MIQIVFYLVYVVTLLLCAGRLAEAGLHRLNLLPRPAAGGQDVMRLFTDLLFLGLVFLAALLSVVSLVWPITGAIQVVFSLMVFVLGGPLIIQTLRTASGSSVAHRHHRLIFILALLYLAWAVVFAAGEVQLYDTGTYHVQAIRWLKEYGVVPGLTNLFGQLGYNSSWHVFCSFLDHGSLGDGKSYHVAGPLVSICCLVIGLEGCQQLAAGRRSISAFLRLFGFVALTYFYRDFVASLGTDMIAAVLVYYALVRSSDAMEEPSTANGQIKSSRDQQRTLVLVTAVTVFAVTVKLSVLPCLLFPCLLWFRRHKERIRQALSCLGLAACVGLPFLARNYVLSGYLLYPQTQFDVFHCDWKVPPADVRVMKYYISEFAISQGKDLDLAGMGVGAKWTAWFRAWGGSRTVQWLLVWAAAGLASCMVLLFCRAREFKRYLLGRWGLFGVIMAGATFCVVTAPEPRFLGVWGLAAGYFPVAWLADFLADRFAARMLLPTSAAFILLFAFGLFLFAPGLFRRTVQYVTNGRAFSATAVTPLHMNSLGNQDEDKPAFAELTTERNRLVRMVWTLGNLPRIAVTNEQNANGARVNVPVRSNKLWDAPLPATQRLHPWLQMRGASLKDGFRVTQDAEWICLDPRHHHQSDSPTPP